MLCACVFFGRKCRETLEHSRQRQQLGICVLTVNSIHALNDIRNSNKEILQAKPIIVVILLQTVKREVG